MNTLFRTVGYCLLAGMFSCNFSETEVLTANVPITPVIVETETAPKKSIRKIKLAVLLDTSGSMEGLIEQTKNQLWKIINTLAYAKDSEGLDPEIELALYQYGNDGLSIQDGYVQQISGFTTELDEISEQLFALRTNGGSEYCGTVINSSLKELNWSDSSDDLQLIFIAGNEPFTQGAIDYIGACKEANSKHIIVNTIFCGNYDQGLRTNWKNGADLGMGKYMNIDHDAKVVHVVSPYDAELSTLNQQLNDTYIPYGDQGRLKKSKQISQDISSQSYGSANATKRYMAKGSKVYKNSSWDLVDATDKKGFDIEQVKNEDLPQNMQEMNAEEKRVYVSQFKTERENIKIEIKVLSKKRIAHVQKVNTQNGLNTEDQLDHAIISAIMEQAKKKSFQFEVD